MSARVGDRRRAREYALQALFQLDLVPERDTETAMEEFWSGKKVHDAVRQFADELVIGTMGHRDGFDQILATSALNWRVSRMAVVDRNVLRMALYEFLFQPATPRVVVIDEAIEIAKKFGTEESGVFINGILDAIRIKLESGELVPPAGLGAIPERSTA